MSERTKALRPTIQAAFDAGGLYSICELFAKLEARIEELEKRLNMNSSKSSKPPSSDGLKRKIKSLRNTNTGRKPGGQPGHIGQTLPQSCTPKIIHSIAFEYCPDCNAGLRDEPVAREEKRQVFDLPPIAMEVNEHLAESNGCRTCAKWVTAAVSAPVQYGPGMQSVMSCLNIAQHLPCERTADVCQYLFGHRPSAGSIVRAVARCAEKVAPAVDRVAAALREAKQLHADKTGVRSGGDTEWIHVASTATHTLFNHSPKRGRQGFEVGGVLKAYGGNLITDF